MGSTPILESVGNSTFHALQATIERRYQKGLTVLANFQFSKAIDDSSANKQNGNVRTNPANQRFDKGPADFYRKYVFNLSGLYELPIHPAKPLTRALIGGWNLNAIASVNTGAPFTVTSGVDNALTGAGGQRADLVGDPHFSGDRNHQAIISQYLNTAASRPMPSALTAVLGRNTFIGPGFANLDLGIVKDFAPQERFKAQLRFEMFNCAQSRQFLDFRRHRGPAERSCRLRAPAIRAFCSSHCASGFDRACPLAQSVRRARLPGQS